MSPEIRPVTEEEFPNFVRADAAAFGTTASAEEVEIARATTELDRTLAVFEDGEIIGTAGALSFEITLPGCSFLPAAGVTWVSVLPTHRRRGILTSLMTRQLADVRERGEPLAILLASESVIYGRFGYGQGMSHVQMEIDPRFGGFLSPSNTSGRLSFATADHARDVLPVVFDRVRRQRSGQITRSDGYWNSFLRDPEVWRDGMSARFYVVYTSEAGEPDGYVAYRMKENWEHGVPQHTFRITELMAATDEAYRALWSYCLNVDLVRTVEVYRRPVDDPIRWMLADPRRLRVSEYEDYLWVRLVDIAAALAGRRYTVDGRLNFDITDCFCPDNSGTYSLEGGPDGATCRRTDDLADLTLSVNDLGATFLGGVSFTTLAHAGRVTERVAGAIQVANAMFACYPAAWCSTGF